MLEKSSVASVELLSGVNFIYLIGLALKNGKLSFVSLVPLLYFALAAVTVGVA